MQSFNESYTIEDTFNQCPLNQVCRIDGRTCLQTNLNVSEICEHVNSLCEIHALESRCYKSENPGKYAANFFNIKLFQFLI